MKLPIPKCRQVLPIHKHRLALKGKSSRIVGLRLNLDRLTAKLNKDCRDADFLAYQLNEATARGLTEFDSATFMSHKKIEIFGKL